MTQPGVGGRGFIQGRGAWFEASETAGCGGEIRLKERAFGPVGTVIVASFTSDVVETCYDATYCPFRWRIPLEIVDEMWDNEKVVK